MAKAKFATVKGSSTLGTDPFYIGLVQHERTMTAKEAYEYLADKIGYKATAIKAAFMGLKQYCRENAQRGNITFLDGIASIRNSVKGGFGSANGPWVKGENLLMVGSVELDPFKSTLSGIVPENMTGGANPIINTVFDETTKVYDLIKGTNVFSIAGSDLGPDSTKTDEYVALVGADGVEHKCTITYSDLGNVKAKLPAAITTGEYTLRVYTRSGLGEAFGVKCATRKVSYIAA